MIVEHFKLQGPSEYSEIPGNFRPIDSSPRDMGPPSADRCSHLLANWWWEIDGNWVIYVCISRCAIQFDVLQSTGLSWDFLKLVKKCFPCCSCTAWHQRTLGQNTGVSIHPVSGSIWRFNMLSHVTRCYKMLLKYLISLSLKSFSLSARHSKTILPGHRFVLRTNLAATANATAKMAVTRWLDDCRPNCSGLRPVLRLLSRFNGDYPQFISVYLTQCRTSAICHHGGRQFCEGQNFWTYHSIHQFFVKSCNSTLQAFRILWSWNPDLTSFNIFISFGL